MQIQATPTLPTFQVKECTKYLMPSLQMVMELTMFLITTPTLFFPDDPTLKFKSLIAGEA